MHAAGTGFIGRMDVPHCHTFHSDDETFWSDSLPLRGRWFFFSLLLLVVGFFVCFCLFLFFLIYFNLLFFLLVLYLYRQVSCKFL